MSHVGIFWFVPSNMPGTSTLVADVTSIGLAPVRERLKTPTRSHAAYWSTLAQQSAKILRAHGLPRIIATSAYNTYPRGHVVFDPIQQHYTIYADPHLHREDFIAEIAFYFGISEGRFSVQSDPDYAGNLSVPPPKDIW